MTEEDARKVLATIIEHERFSYREAVRWALQRIDYLEMEVDSLEYAAQESDEYIGL